MLRKLTTTLMVPFFAAVIAVGMQAETVHTQAQDVVGGVRTKAPDREDYRAVRRGSATSITRPGASGQTAVGGLQRLQIADSVARPIASAEDSYDDYNADRSFPAEPSVSISGLKPVVIDDVNLAAVSVESPRASLPPIAADFNEPVRSSIPQPISVQQVAHNHEGHDHAVHATTPDHSTIQHTQFEHYDSLGSLACDSGCGCGQASCDSLGCDGFPGSYSGTGISFAAGQWFGSAELMLMFRKGDVLPPLVTTGPSTDADTAGELGQAGTSVLAGNDSVFTDVTAGGRFTLGTWLDSRHCRSLVFRGWLSGEQTYDFTANQSTQAVLARPFFDVSDTTPTPTQDAQLIAFPGRSNGSISVVGDSNVYGADIQVRQFWRGDFGGSVDFLYGYQHMRLDESLGISSISTSLDADFAPLGSVLAVSDTFESESEFHGGQLGFASRYREGCWSFDGLIKVAFGQLRRTARRTGQTVASVDGLSSTTNQGLLVRDTNSGEFTDHTFGWVPELDLTLGWHRYKRFDVTFGYHLIAMTDALQVGGTIDPALAVNLTTPAVGQQRPGRTADYETFFLHGIHFGLAYRY